MDFKNIFKMMAIGLILFVSINNAFASDKSINVTEKSVKRINQVKPIDPILQGKIISAMQRLKNSYQKAALNIRREINKYQERINYSNKRADIRNFLDLANKYDDLATLVGKKKSALSKHSEGLTISKLKFIQDTIKDVEDDQSMVQFKIQQATSDLQNAENVRSQAEKRLEEQREDLTRNWDG